MKWWYVLVLIVGVGIGWWILKNYGIKKSTSEVSNPSTQVTTNNKGVKVETGRISGIVQSWDYKNGALEVLVDGKTRNLTIDLTKTRMMVKEKNTLRWTTAFCPADTLTGGYDGELFPQAEALSRA
jgi:hypothetical protein